MKNRFSTLIGILGISATFAACSALKPGSVPPTSVAPPISVTPPGPPSSVPPTAPHTPPRTGPGRGQLLLQNLLTGEDLAHAKRDFLAHSNFREAAPNK